MRKLERSNPAESDAEHWYLIATAYGLMGDKAGCIRALGRAVDGGFFNYPCFQRDPCLDGVRGEAEFEAVLARAKERHEAFKSAIASNRTKAIG